MRITPKRSRASCAARFKSELGRHRRQRASVKWYIKTSRSSGVRLLGPSLRRAKADEWESSQVVCFSPGSRLIPNRGMSWMKAAGP